MSRFFFFVFLFIIITGCESKINHDAQLYDFMEAFTGKFSSKKQAEQDSGYSKITLINTPIWEDRSGYWFYHELHKEQDPSFVYNQRIIHIKRIDSVTISSANYIIPNQKKYINGWKDLSVFDDLIMDSLKIRDGCDLYFKKKTSTIYQGKTKKGACLSSFKTNMSYITSNVVISKERITSWDRGYDINGKQVWGKIQGPYKYIRISEN
ncbi:chromophore lyase CpcT/CpeT [Aquimarina sp. 2201CG14-23]|uniref:chromophore lyase CpcT/CpeT n=1 Tax=Aquimarina mycalae TaxID=3040073 RepID=UPI002477E12F|nr:chromophore lyase CpcT/CpeT [Aquimarina sp. 2201CG14-23]MDH7444734.1 chromophore lyase CpcT/CpeT [Aquimarina sp. 2201CG14-23]